MIQKMNDYVQYSCIDQNLNINIIKLKFKL